MRLMSWQAPQVSVKRCFIAPSGHSLAVYCAWADVTCANTARTSNAQLVSARVTLIGMVVPP
jgi:stage V sporulation protein SpoVS